MRKFTIDFYKKDSGKWYSSSELEIDTFDFWDGVVKIKNMHRDGELPGLTCGGKGFHIILRDIESNISHLFLEN
jgi:hypothetical protein